MSGTIKVSTMQVPSTGFDPAGTLRDKVEEIPIEKALPCTGRRNEEGKLEVDGPVQCKRPSTYVWPGRNGYQLCDGCASPTTKWAHERGRML